MTKELAELLARAEGVLARLETLLPGPAAAPDWDAAVAFRWQRRHGRTALRPVRAPHRIMLADIQDVDEQKARIDRNTRQFLAGRRANNVLLTGARGTGKSSLIKALLNEYAARGLRLIEVDKTDLVDLPEIVELVAGRPERFILFCDDLSFEEGEDAYKAFGCVPNVSKYENEPTKLHEAMVAEVALSDGEAESFARHNGKRAVLIAAPMKESQNVFEVRGRISQELDTWQTSLPASIQLERGFDQSKNVAHRLQGFVRDFGLAILLVLITLLPLGMRGGSSFARQTSGNSIEKVAPLPGTVVALGSSGWLITWSSVLYVGGTAPAAAGGRAGRAWGSTSSNSTSS